MSINASKRAHWQREAKQTLAASANDTVVLRHAATLFEEDMFILVDDFKSFFNQVVVKQLLMDAS
jgi:hypothetical protein